MNRSTFKVVFAHRGSGFGVWPGICQRRGAAGTGTLDGQRYGTAEAVDPVNNQRGKGMIFKALGKEDELTFSEV